MKRVLAVLLSTFLCVQNVYAMPAKEHIVYEDTQETIEGTEDTENTDDAENIEESEDTENTEVPENVEEIQETVSEDSEGEQPAQEAAGPQVSAPSAVLMEASTGEVIYEKDADTPRPPASVTKVMTMLLIFDALAEGKIKLEDQVTTSEYAASMGGSQVFLEAGETQTVDTMLKCISVASGNDACVA
ncbi:D-alanyl-D-alanine carboxypeptidase family protein, partial [Muricomes intestini]